MKPNAEQGFIATLRAHPADTTTLLVYADWLEDAGERARSQFLRLQQLVQIRTHKAADFAALSKQLLELGRDLAPDWLAVVSRPRLLGTVWTGGSTTGRAYVFRYLDPVKLNYTTPTGTFLNGTWRQIGNVVLMEMNRHYADYEGFIAGDEIRGTASNVANTKWGWTVKRTADPALCDPGSPVTTIYDTHPKKKD